MHQEDRDNAIHWARNLLQQDFVVLDTETTGLGDNDEAVAIGVVDKNGNIMLDTLLCHAEHSSPEALAIHGITWEMTRDAPHFKDVYPGLLEHLQAELYQAPHKPIWINQLPIIAYGLDFDLRILEQTINRYKLGALCPNHTSCTTNCVMRWFAQLYGEWNEYHGNYKWQKLTTAATYFRINPSSAHSAAGDALATLRVVEGMARAKLRGEE